ncbi:hypothetical protein ACNRWW_13805 [Metabacillus sp. HB246100]|uniref:hypothetical protein n=1 Tax=Bacillus weihaiensis TaxID=1547283 RepID=UPI002356FCB1|nr:hypothetical protein [Bacillus weihaiensis]
MYRKICKRCSNKSYSSSKCVRWICPYCGVDLRYESSTVVEHRINIEELNEKIGQMRGRLIYKELS